MYERELSITEDDLKTRPFDPANYLNSFDKMQKFLKIAIRNRKGYVRLLRLLSVQAV